MNQQIRLRAVVIMGVMLVAVLAIAAPAARAQEGPLMRHPRLLEIQRLRRAACASKSVGTTCSYVRPDGQKIAGSCQPSEQGVLACRNVVNGNRGTIRQ